MIRIKYLISNKDLYWFIIVFVLGVLTSIYLPSTIYGETLYSNVISVLSILVGFNATSIAVLYNSKILRDLYNTKDEIYTNALYKIAAYAYSFICASILVILMLMLLSDSLTFYGMEIKHALVVASLFSTGYLFIKNLNYFFELFRLPRNE